MLKSIIEENTENGDLVAVVARDQGELLIGAEDADIVLEDLRETCLVFEHFAVVHIVEVEYASKV